MVMFVAGMVLAALYAVGMLAAMKLPAYRLRIYWACLGLALATAATDAVRASWVAAAIWLMNAALVIACLKLERARRNAS